MARTPQLQNRFYLYGNALASLHTTLPIICDKIRSGECLVDAIAFPDDGAAKRFGGAFGQLLPGHGLPTIICGKVRDGDKRKVTIQDGSPKGRHCLIVDDLVRSGGTLYQCAKVLLEQGARAVSAYVAHAAFPRHSWERFAAGGDYDIFDTFWTTNSVPSVANELPKGNRFHVLDIAPLVVQDLYGRA